MQQVLEIVRGIHDGVLCRRRALETAILVTGGASVVLLTNTSDEFHLDALVGSFFAIPDAYSHLKSIALVRYGQGFERLDDIMSYLARYRVSVVIDGTRYALLFLRLDFNLLSEFLSF